MSQTAPPRVYVLLIAFIKASISRLIGYERHIEHRTRRTQGVTLLCSIAGIYGPARLHAGPPLGKLLWRQYAEGRPGCFSLVLKIYSVDDGSLNHQILTRIAYIAGIIMKRLIQ